MIQGLGGKRNITSAFSSELCILLSIEQDDYPILIVSKAGSMPMGDIRAISLQQPISFTKTWNLVGVVMLSDLVLCLRLIQCTRSSGLVDCSSGNLNDHPENAIFIFFFSPCCSLLSIYALFVYACES